MILSSEKRNKMEKLNVKNKEMGIHVSEGLEPKNDTYKIRIIYSKKLGLTFNYNFSSMDEAFAFIKKIKEKGIIDKQYWTFDFYPWRGYLDYESL
jgi:hypothetical protein